MLPIKLLVLVIFVNEAANCHKIFEQTFAVKSTVYQAASKDVGIVVGSFHESYSPTQQRAHFEYESHYCANGEITRYKDLRQFQVDKSRNISLELSWYHTCTRMEISRFIEQTHLSLLNIGLKEDHLIFGTSKLLLIVEENQTQLKSEGSKEEVRNFVADKYSLEINKRLTFIVFFRKLATSEYIGTYRAPVRIIVQQTDQPEVVVDYLYVQHIHENGAHWMNDQQVTSTDARLDMFTIEPLMGCSVVLADKAETVFQTEDESTTSKFSFEATIEYPALKQTDQSIQRNIFVAFDMRLQSMRVDTIGIDERFISFKYNRLFHIQESGHSRKQANPVEGLIVDPKVSILDYAVDCKVVKLNLTEQQKSLRASIMLTGSDQFVYMGKAVVRGQEADVFEMSRNNMPLWLDLPVEIDTLDPSYNHDKTKPTFIVVLYTKTRSNKNQPIEPLMMDFVEAINDLPVRQIASVKFREFTWNLDTIAPNGDRSSELFSLGERCSTQADLKFAQVEMNLVSAIPDKMLDSFLEIPSLRDLALLATMQQDLSIPVQHVYDLKTRLISLSKSSNVSIAASFRLVEHNPIIAKTTYVNSTYPHGIEPSSFMAGSFSNCHLKALHAGNDIAFGYSRLLKSCAIGVDTKVEKWFSGSLDPFPLFLFKIETTDDRMPSMQLEYLANNADLTKKQNFLGKKLYLVDGDSRSQFTLDKIELQQTRMSQKMNTGRAEELIDTNYMKGFGLANSDRHSQEWEIPSSSDAFVHCKTACAVHHNCESFSVCTKNGRVECVISNQSFRTTPVVQTLINKLKMRPKIGGTFIVKSDEGFDVMLETRPSCELHNREYLQFVTQVKAFQRKYQPEAFIPAPTGVEFCAKMCFDHNIEFLRNRAGKINYGQHMYEFCETFDYISASKLSVEQKNLYKLPKTEVPHEGYCLSSGWHSQLENKTSQGDNRYIPPLVGADRYLFKSDELYEKKYQLGLARSEKSDELKEAYGRIRLNPSESDIKMLKEFHAKGDNSQGEYHGDATNCAYWCLLRIRGPWPGCQSFDVYEIVREKYSHYLCVLNTITLRDALVNKRDDLIIKNHTKGQYIHYEPLMFFKPDFEHISFSNEYISAEGTIVVLLVITLGFIAGTIMGYHLAKTRPIVPTQTENRRESILPLRSVDEFPVNLEF